MPDPAEPTPGLVGIVENRCVHTERRGDRAVSRRAVTAPGHRIRGRQVMPARFPASGLHQPGACPGIVPELALRVEAAEEGPDGHPTQGDDGDLARTQPQRADDGERRQEPQPAQYVAPERTRLRHRGAVAVPQSDVPGLHGQRLALGPEPGEIDAEDHEQESHAQRAEVQRVA